MTDLRIAAQQALEALEGWENHDRWVWPESALEQAKSNTTKALATLKAALAEDTRDWSLLEATQESLREHMAEIQRLRAALAQPATIAEWWAAKQADSGEPVAWQAVGGSIWAHKTREDDRPLYAAPQPAPARGPLPEAQINEFAAEAETPAWGEWYSDEDALMKFARAIEAAHGIGTPAKEAP